MCRSVSRAVEIGILRRVEPSVVRARPSASLGCWEGADCCARARAAGREPGWPTGGRVLVSALRRPARWGARRRVLSHCQSAALSGEIKSEFFCTSIYFRRSRPAPRAPRSVESDAPSSPRSRPPTPTISSVVCQCPRHSNPTHPVHQIASRSRPTPLNPSHPPRSHPRADSHRSRPRRQTHDHSHVLPDSRPYLPSPRPLPPSLSFLGALPSHHTLAGMSNMGGAGAAAGSDAPSANCGASGGGVWYAGGSTGADWAAG